jgi:cytochrome c
MKTPFITLAAVALLALSGAATADQKLAQKHACMSCHQVAKKVVGPAFADVAKKYKGNTGAASHLLEVIKKGGKGVWGTVPMPPHPQVSEADAKSIVNWVLGL